MKGRTSPKRLHIGKTQMIRGQLYEDLWAEREADASVLKLGITGFAGGTAGDPSWTQRARERWREQSIQRTGVQGLPSHARKLEG